MSAADLDYIEKLKRKNQAPESSGLRAGASVEPPKPQVSDYDWFDFFLAAGVGPHQCERYAQAMVKDSMDESVLPDITTDTLRTLGLKEGDALKVMKYLDQRFNRTKTNGTSEAGPAGIFSGPGGVLHNNTRRGRPDANRSTGDVVDAGAFESGDTTKAVADTKPTPQVQVPDREAQNGFDDDAWEVKPSAQTGSAATRASSGGAAPRTLSENVQALSLLDKPLEPTPAAPPRPVSQPQLSEQSTASTTNSIPQQPQQTGANPSFFSQLNQQSQAASQTNAPRQRPQAPQQSFTGSSLLPPPPRPTSAPQHNQFGQQSLQPQFTGISRNAANQTAPGQSLDEITAQRMQQQFQMQPQPTGYGQTYASFANGMQPQPTGFQPQMQFGQPQQTFLNGNIAGSPFADPRAAFQPQPTGYGLQPGPAPGSLNSVLPPALIPQKTGFQSPPPQMPMNGFNSSLQSQPTGFMPMQPQMTGYQQPIQPQPTGWAQPSQQNGFGNTQLPPIPPMPEQRTPAPLVAQKTGPAPNVKFGVTEAKRLAPQPTGRRANLSAATPQNPFGF